MKGKKRFVKLTDAQRKELESGHKSGKTATFRERCQIILLSDQGYTIDQIRPILSIGRNTVIRWFDRYESDGIDNLHTKKGQGAPPILRLDNQVESSLVDELIEQHAQNLNPMLTELEAELGKKMSKRTLQRFLKKKNIAGNDLDELPLKSQTH